MAELFTVRSLCHHQAPARQTGNNSAMSSQTSLLLPNALSGATMAGSIGTARDEDWKIGR
jgi:hypothetical protein